MDTISTSISGPTSSYEALTFQEAPEQLVSERNCGLTPFVSPACVALPSSFSAFFATLSTTCLEPDSIPACSSGHGQDVLLDQREKHM